MADCAKRHAGTVNTAFHCLGLTLSAVQVAVFGTARSPHFSLAIISITVQLWIWVFWVISVYFNIRNTLPDSGTFLLGHPVYTYTNKEHVLIYFVFINHDHL